VSRGPAEGGPVRDPVPSGRAVRRYTAAVARRRGGASVGSLLVDVYTVPVTTAVGVVVAIGVVDAVRDLLPPHPGAGPAGREVSLPTLAGRLGPVGVGGAEATWWLTLPVARRALLRPAAVRLPLAAGAVGAIVLPCSTSPCARPADRRSSGSWP
jgi:hypothetical protein